MDSILFQSVRLQLIENLHQTPDLAELARVSGVGKKRLNEAFRQCVGVTVLEYLREERMRQACVRLTETTLNMQEIALALGFSSGANFATAFKERFGLCPSDFRAVRSGTGPVISRLATDAA
jgi:AraC-like DNA-binding protein